MFLDVKLIAAKPAKIVSEFYSEREKVPENRGQQFYSPTALTLDKRRGVRSAASFRRRCANPGRLRFPRLKQ
jgi:hypothetical protein